jgi:gliding motility-associated-like protein
LEIETDNGVLFDDGGENNNYSDTINALVYIKAASNNKSLCLKGILDLEDEAFSSLEIYKGDTSSKELFGIYSDHDTISLQSEEGFTLRFITNTSSPKSGFKLDINAISPFPKNVNAIINYDNNSIEVSWEGETSSYWIVEQYNKNLPTFHYTTTENNIVLDSIPTIDCDFSIEYSIFSKEDSLNSSCLKTYFKFSKDTLVINADICDKSSYTDNGFNEDSSGVYFQNLTSAIGCDSTLMLILNVHLPYTSDTILDTICQGDIYQEHGLEEDSAGVYISNLQSIYGCDSTLIVKLWVNPSYYDTIKADIYKGNTYNEHGFNESVTGIYTQDNKTIHGCDSILVLDLQVDNVMFPNVITPNADGINDVFEIHNLIEQEVFYESELRIYSQNGKLIYSVNNIKKREDLWDPQKTKSPDGTYFYIFKGKRKDKTLKYNGAVEVLR